MLEYLAHEVSNDSNRLSNFCNAFDDEKSHFSVKAAKSSLPHRTVKSRPIFMKLCGIVYNVKKLEVVVTELLQVIYFGEKSALNKC